MSVIGSSALICLACGKTTLFSSYNILTTFVVSRHFITVTFEHKVASYNPNHEENLTENSFSCGRVPLIGGFKITAMK